MSADIQEAARGLIETPPRVIEVEGLRPIVVYPREAVLEMERGASALPLLLSGHPDASVSVGNGLGSLREEISVSQIRRPIAALSNDSPIVALVPQTPPVNAPKFTGKSRPRADAFVMFSYMWSQRRGAEMSDRKESKSESESTARTTAPHLTNYRSSKQMSCADVCISVDIDESPAFYSESVRRAAKPYRCCECRAVIGTGDRHEYVSGKWDGSIMDFRTCLPCAEIRKAFCCGAWVLESLWEDMDEQVFPEWKRNELSILDCLAKLTTDTATTKVRTMYSAYIKDRD